MANRKTASSKRPTKTNKTIITKKWTFLGFGFLILFAGAFIWYIIHIWKQQQAEAKAEAAIYSVFGINIPYNYSIHGIDVSSHQNVIAWHKVATMQVNKVRMGFAFIKASEGLGNSDKNYETNYNHAKKAGIVCGAYHFFLATKSGEMQANNFLNTASLTKGDLPPVVDIEQLYGVQPVQMRKRLKEFLTITEQAYHVKPIIYTNVDFYEKYIGSEFNEYPLWVAHYEEPNKPRIGRDWLFWQHSESAHINGITTPVDCNVFYGDSVAFKELLIH
jgi:lysozyme